MLWKTEVGSERKRKKVKRKRSEY